MPNIFIGLFMGLGSAFLTLVVAETVGVKSGLGWYLSWAKEWAEYGKVYSALIIMAVFFSTMMAEPGERDVEPVAPLTGVPA